MDVSSTAPDPAVLEPARTGLDTSELELALGFWLRLAQQLDQREYTRRLAASGLNPLAYSILLVVEANPGCRQTDLGSALRIRQPNLVEPLETLATRGLISRAPDPRDRRAQVLALTADGSEQLAALKATHGAMIEGYRARLGDEGYGQLIALLRAFVDGAPR
jgi:DNA-binding MarR family transcriptional regulator